MIDIVIVGAGVAGLTAAAQLTRAGKVVRCLEATDRIGGRILTVHDPLSSVAIELGAEFIHGRPPETWDIIRKGSLMAYEHTSHALQMENGTIHEAKDVEDILPKPGRRKDESFESFIRRSLHPDDVKESARRYAEGFNAARSELIGVASLKQDADAAEQIEGDRSFRIPGGYDQIPLSLFRSIPDNSAVVQLNSIVERVKWRRGSAELRYRSALDHQVTSLRCRQVVVTVPLGVLQSGSIAFDPEPSGILKAAAILKFGQVYRITCRFENAFWEDNESLKRVGFLMSRENRFPTWWTTHPVVAPVLTGWMAGSAAEGFRPVDREALVAESLSSLSRILGRKIPQPQATYFHDWQADPFFRGAYSFVPVNGIPAREALTKPVENTLFFAGEATNTKGHGSTVHGAIESGLRVARQLL